MKRIVVAVALAVIASNAIAQESAVIDVQVTNLDVVVTDNKGKRVTGLTKGDFEILENGQPMEITNLSEISRTSTSGGETIQPAPRRILLIVDNGSIALAARRKVFDATRKTLEHLVVGPSDRVSIVTISRTNKERLAWTANRDEVLKTLAEVEKDAILPNVDLIAFERSLETLIDEANEGSASMVVGGPEAGTGTGNPNDPDNPPTGGGGGAAGGRGTGGSARVKPPIEFNMFITQARNYAAAATNDSRQTLSAMNAALASFAAVPGGRKIAIIVGGGLPINAADAVFQKIESVREQFERPDNRSRVVGAKQASTLTQISGYDIGREVDALAASAKMKGVAFYAVNPEFGDRKAANASSRSNSDSIAEFAVMRGMLDGYQRLANATGGAALIGRPADLVMTEIIEDLDSYYSIGYRASGPLDPKSNIVVKVRKGLTARATIASGAISRDWEVADQVLANHVAATDPANPLSISVTMDPPVVDAEKKTIPMKIMIPVNSLKLVPDKGEYAAAFAVFISLGDASGNGSQPSRQEQTFRWPENAIEQIKGKTIGFAVNVEVSGEIARDRISVGVLDQYSGSAGFARVMLN